MLLQSQSLARFQEEVGRREVRMLLQLLLTQALVDLTYAGVDICCFILAAAHCSRRVLLLLLLLLYQLDDALVLPFVLVRVVCVHVFLVFIPHRLIASICCRLRAHLMVRLDAVLDTGEVLHETGDMRCRKLFALRHGLEATAVPIQSFSFLVGAVRDILGKPVAVDEW